MTAIAQIIAAITGRRIAEAATAASPADPAEVADLKARLAASQNQVRRLCDVIAERDKELRTADEEIVRLRAANERLANQAETTLGQRYHPLRPPALSDTAARQAAQDRRNAIAADNRLALAEGRPIGQAVKDVDELLQGISLLDDFSPGLALHLKGDGTRLRLLLLGAS